MAMVKPGLFHGGLASHGAKELRRAGQRLVPLAVSLPITVVISLGLWAGLFLIIKALL